MRKLHIAIVVYIISMCFARDIREREREQYNRLTENNSDGRGSIHSDIGSAGDSWQPVSRRNWIILNSDTENKAAAAAAHSTTMTPSNHRNHMYSQIHQRHSAAANTNAYSQAELGFQQHEWHRDQRGHSHLHSLPINYYTYNHSADGNYLLPTAPDVKLIEPYVLTISRMRTRTGSSSGSGSNSDAVLTRRLSQSSVVDASSSFSGAITLPKDVVGNLILQQKENRQDIENNAEHEKWRNHGKTQDATVTSVPDESNVETESFFDKIEADGAHFNKIFLPLRHTLDKVIYFCDIAKRFISDDDNDDNNENEDMNDNDVNSEDGPSKIITAIDETPDGVQGRNSLSPSSTMLSLLTNASTGRNQPTATQETTTLSSFGTGRKLKKLKKKLSKFFLPLLLAYKLKFLTLIPVLIGGLILLVGTTGLAGFFFALFTAVMSLKSTGGSKSIIVKKI